MIVISGALTTLWLVWAVVLLLRMLTSTRVPKGAAFDSMDFCHRPMKRLLDPAELQYLRKQGVREEIVTKLRTQRREIYRLYLRDLVQEFNKVHESLKLLLVSSYSDRPDMARLLMKKKFTFYRNLFLVEGWLTLHACGVDKMPDIDIARSLEIIQLQFLELAPVRVSAASEL